MSGAQAQHSRRDRILVLALVAAALLLRLAIASAYDFDGLYGQDAYANYDYGAALLALVRTGQPPGPFFWPLGYPLVLAASFALSGIAPLSAQGVTLLLGALLPALVYALARQLGGSTSGAFVAALIVTICGQAVQSSIVIMSDIPALAWATASAVSLWQYRHTRQRRWLVAAALLLALAGITRWLYLGLLIPWALAACIDLRPTRRADLLTAASVFALLLLPQLVISQNGPSPVTDHSWLTGWSPANAFQRTFLNVDGSFHYDTANAAFYSGVLTDAYFLAPVFVPLCALGLVGLLRCWRDGRALLLGGWLLLPYLFLVGIPYQNIRFMLIMLPPVAVLAGLGTDRALAVLPRRVGWLALGLLLLSAALSTGSASAGTLGRFLQAQARDAQTAAWAAARLPTGATVYTFGLTLRLRHTAPLEVIELYYETPQTLSARRAHERSAYLLINEWVIENQWRDTDLQSAVDWLRTQRGLVDLGQSGYYRLYQVLP